MVCKYSCWSCQSFPELANSGNDLWRVDVSNNAGISWTSLEETNDNANYWLNQQFLINENLLELSNQVQFRFVAEDISYEGDNGSGGSIIEAAIDDFKILNFDNQLLGDSNYDGQLNVLDVVILVNMVLEIQEPDFIGDINNDGGLNIQDIVLLINIILE